MATVPIWTTASGASGSAVIAGFNFHYIFASGPLADPQTTEAIRRVRYRSPGTWTRLFVDVVANTISSGSSTVTSRINGAPGGQSISIPFGATGHFEDVSGSDAIAAGDDVGIRVAGGPGGTTINLRTLGGAFEATTNTVTRLSTCSDTLATTSNYFGGVTGTTLGPTEAPYQTLIKTAATFKNASVYVDANSRNGASVMVLRVNGVDTALTITIPATTTGTFEDTTHSVSVVPGDLVNWRLQAAGSSGGCSCITIGVDQETTTGEATFSGWNQQAVTPGATTFVSPLGGQAVASEADAQHRSQVTGVLSRLSYRPLTNTLNGVTTFRLRINGAYGTSIVTVAAGTSGETEDLVHEDLIAAGDDLAIEINTTASSSGTMTFGQHGVLWGPPPSDKVGCLVAGVTTTVAATRAISFGLDGDVHVDTRPGTFTVHGDTWLDGETEIEGDTLIHGNLEVEGDTVMDGDLTVLGTLTAPGVPGAPLDAGYVTIGADTELSAERVLTAGTGITITDGGPGSTVTITATGGAASTHYDCPLSDGDLVAAEIIFASGDCVIVQVPL